MLELVKYDAQIQILSSSFKRTERVHVDVDVSVHARLKHAIRTRTRNKDLMGWEH